MFHTRVDLGRMGMLVGVAVAVVAVGLLGVLAGNAAAASTSGNRTQGYWEVTAAGDVYSFGSAPFYGSAGNLTLAQPIVAMAAVPGGGGYWLVGRDGGVFSYGVARYYGSVPGLPASSRPTAPVVDLVPSADGQGYWEVTAAGDVYSFGDAGFYGSAGNLTLSKPIVGMAVTPGGGGYWLVASDGGVFSYGDASYFGSVPGLPASQRPSAPVVGLVPNAGGQGYWEVTSAGDIYSFGSAPFYGSAGNLTLAQPIVSMAAVPGGGGYWLVARDGGVFSYGEASYYGSVPGLPASQRPSTPVVGFVPAKTTSTPTSTSTSTPTPAPTPTSTPLSIATTSLPNATAGQPYSFTLQAAGGTPPYSWTVTSGSLPAGLDLSSAGVISGTPSTSGSAAFTVQVTDSSTPNPQVASAGETVLVSSPAAPPLTITTSSLPGATAGSSYTATIDASGGTPPYSWSITSGSLPPGLSLSSDGIIAGTPTVQGNASFTAQVTDSSTPSAETASTTLSISVAAAPISRSANWSGYVVPSSASLVTEVSGEWTVPTLDCAATPNGIAGIWVGIGGDSSGVLLQTGVFPTCVDGEQQNVGWWEEYPSSRNHEANFADFPVSAGDVIEASVYETTTGAWQTRVNDLSTGLSGIMITGEGWGVYSDGSGSSFPEQGSTAGLSYSGGYTAEWIVEDPGTGTTTTPAPFADYGTVTFSDLTTSLPSWSLTSDEAVEMVQRSTVLSTPSPPSTHGFSVNYTG